MIAMWQVFAKLWNIQARVDAQERRSLIESGIRIGVALVTEKPAHSDYRGYGQMISEQAAQAHIQLRAPQSESLARVIGTQSQTLPAIDPRTGYYIGSGRLARKAIQQRKAGQ